MIEACLDNDVIYDDEVMSVMVRWGVMEYLQVVHSHVHILRDC